MGAIDKDTAFHIAAFTGIRSDLLNPVNVELCNEAVAKAAYKVRLERNACFKNVALMVLANSKATYCLGVAHLGLYGGHAWIEIDGHRYDPTLEFCTDSGLSDEYYELKRYSHADLWAWFDNPANKDLPPSLVNAAKDCIDTAFFDRLLAIESGLADAAKRYNEE